MTRFVMFALLTAIGVLCILGIYFLKDSYRLLPISASKIGAATEFSSWLKFDAPSGKFNVMMPAVPQNATQNITDPKTKELRHYDMFVAQKGNGSMFIVSLIKFATNSSPPEILKKTVINDLLASNAQNQLQEMKVGTFENYQTMEFTISNPNTTVKGMTFVDGNTLYLISAVFPNQFFSVDDYEHFVNSFHLANTKLPK